MTAPTSVTRFEAPERVTTDAVIRVTAEDTEMGDRSVWEITDDVVVTCAGRHYVAQVAKYGNGTQVWTIKVVPA